MYIPFAVSLINSNEVKPRGLLPKGKHPVKYIPHACVYEDILGDFRVHPNVSQFCAESM